MPLLIISANTVSGTNFSPAATALYRAKNQRYFSLCAGLTACLFLLISFYVNIAAPYECEKSAKQECRTKNQKPCYEKSPKLQPVVGRSGTASLLSDSLPSIG